MPRKPRISFSFWGPTAGLMAARGTPGGSADSRDILVQLFAADGSPAAGGPILVNTAI